MAIVAVVEALEFIWWAVVFLYGCVFVPTLLRLRQIHINLRALMANVVGDSLLSVGSRLILRLIERYGNIQSNGVDTPAVCTIFSFANVFFLISGTGTLMILCMERYVATRMRDGYEHSGGRLGWVAVVVKYVISAILTAALMFTMRSSAPLPTTTPTPSRRSTTASPDAGDDTIDNCSFIDYHPLTMIIIYGMGILCFLLGLTITIYLYEQNVQHRKQIVDNLTVRFQFKENIAATQMLKYQMQCYFGISLIGAPVAVLNFFIQQSPSAAMLFQLLNQTPFVLFLFYTMFYMLHVTFYYDAYFLNLTKPLMDRFCCVFPALVAEADLHKDHMTQEEEREFHFKQINEREDGDDVRKVETTDREWI